MKKLLTIMSSFSLFSLSTLTVVSCASNKDYDAIFTMVDKGNDGKFVNNATAKIISKLESYTKQPSAFDIKLPSNQPTRSLESVSAADKEVVIAQMKESLSKDLNIDSDQFKLEITNDNTFYLPELLGIDSKTQIIENASIKYGNARISLTYLNQEIFEGDMEWFLPEYKIISEVSNLLNANSLKIQSIFDVKKIDIPLGSFDMGGMSMDLTLGTLSSMIGLLSIVYGIMGDAGTAIQELMAMDVKGLSEADPDSNTGKAVYDKFDADFRNKLQRIIVGIKKLLDNLGVSSTFEIPPTTEGAEPIVVSLDNILDLNVLELIGFDISTMNMSVSQDGADITVRAKLVSKGVENQIKLADLLANFAPNIVKILNKFLNKDTYDVKKGGTKNILFLLLRELLTPMDADLLSLHDKNHSPAIRTSSGLGSILANALMGYNKNKRTEKEANIYFHLQVDVDYSLLVTSVFIRLLDDDLPNLLEKININFEGIILTIINKLFKIEGTTDSEKFLDLNTPFISSQENMVFLPEEDINWTLIADGAKSKDGSSSSGFMKEALNALEGIIKPLIAENVNSQINAALPTLSLQDIINMAPSAMLEQLGVVNDNTGAQTTIVKAKFRFEFYDTAQKAWIPIVDGINDRVFEIYNGIRVNLSQMQFRIDYNSTYNGNYSVLTRDDLAYYIVFSSDDL